MSGTACRSRPNLATMSAQSPGWHFIWAYSSSVKAAGFVRIASGTPSLPMSWKRPACEIASSCEPVIPSSRAIDTAISWTRCECPASVGVAGVHRRVQRLDGLERVLFEHGVGIAELGRPDR